VPSGPGTVQCVGYLRVWDRTTGKVIRTPAHNPTDYFCALTFSADGKKLFCGTRGTTERSGLLRGERATWSASRVFCWDTTTWAELWSADGEHFRVDHLVLSPSGDRLLAADHGGCGCSTRRPATPRWAGPAAA